MILKDLFKEKTDLKEIFINLVAIFFKLLIDKDIEKIFITCLSLGQ